MAVVLALPAKSPLPRTRFPVAACRPETLVTSTGATRLRRARLRRPTDVLRHAFVFVSRKRGRHCIQTATAGPIERRRRVLIYVSRISGRQISVKRLAKTQLLPQPGFAPANHPTIRSSCLTGIKLCGSSQKLRLHASRHGRALCQSCNLRGPRRCYAMACRTVRAPKVSSKGAASDWQPPAPPGVCVVFRMTTARTNLPAEPEPINRTLGLLRLRKFPKLPHASVNLGQMADVFRPSPKFVASFSD
jgi:hypothetical protein